MANSLGAISVTLGLDTASVTDGLTKADAQMKRMAKQWERVGQEMRGFGQALTLGLTVPLAAMGVGAIKASGDFESAMIKVGISTKATASEMAALEAKARAIGKATIFGASDAADAMDMLAKTGVDTTAILGGAAEATVNLAAAAGSELAPAASAISDSMQQFKLTADQLPAVVNQITGAVNQSKLSFEDFALAQGQAGGTAAALGVSFEDFNAVLAGTSTQFTSGSDAGTSFKTFLGQLTPDTKDAKEQMAKFGLTLADGTNLFYDASGGLKSMADIAQLLQDKLGKLSDQDKGIVLKAIFGRDAARTAIGLIDQGAEGINRISKAIRETDAAGQAAKRMQGFKGQLDQLKGSFEDLGIAIGKSGLLDFATKLVKGIGELVDKAAALPPHVLAMATGFAVAAAAIGPAIFLAGQMALTVNQLIILAPILGGAMRTMGVTMAGAFGPVGIAIAGVTALLAVGFVVASQKATSETVELHKAFNGLAGVVGDELTGNLKRLTAVLDNVVAPALNIVGTAMTVAGEATAYFLNRLTDLIGLAASNKFAQFIAKAGELISLGNVAGVVVHGLNEAGGALKGQRHMRTDRNMGADRARQQAAAMAAAEAAGKPSKPDGGGGGGAGGGSGGKGRTPTDRNEEALNAAARDELAARLALIGNIEEIAALKAKQVDLELKAEKARIAEQLKDKEISQATAASLIASQDKVAADRKTVILRERDEALAEDALRHGEELAGYAERSRQVAIALATTAEERGRLEAESLAARQEQETARKAEELKQGVKLERITQAFADQEMAALRTAQAEERKGQAAATQEAVLREASQTAQETLQVQIEEARRALGLADTVLERYQAQKRIVELERELERLKQQEIIDAQASTPTQKDIARLRLEQLGDAKTQAEDEKAARQAAIDAFYEQSSAVGRAVDAFERHDFVDLFQSMATAVQNIVTAFEGADLAQKITSVAGLFNALGQQIGGTAGGAISGAASGAAAGATIGSIVPGIGTAIGAVVGGLIGGIGGIFGASKKKKQAKAQRAAEVANQRAELEIAVLEAQGKSLEAAARRREIERSKIDASNLALYDQAEALRAAQEAADSAAAAYQGFVDAILGDAEKLARSTAEVAAGFAALGVALPASRAAFRALVEGVDMTAEGGQALYDGLLALAPQFAEVADAGERAAEDLADRWAEFTDAFLTDGQKLALTQASVGQQLDALSTQFGRADVAALATHQAFFDLVSGLDASSPLRAALLELAPQFDIVADALEQAAADAAEAAADAWSDFADSFQTDGQKLAAVQKAVTARLGELSAEFGRADVAALQTHQAFFDLVSGLDASSHLRAALLELAPQFGAVANALEAAAEAAATAAEEAAAKAREIWAHFTDSFLTAAQRMAPRVAALRGELVALDLGWIDSRQTFANAVLALRGMGAAGETLLTSLLELEPEFDQVASFLEARWGFFTDNFLTDAQRLAPAATELNARLAGLGASFPTLGIGAGMTREAFAHLVTTISPQSALYQSLLDLAPLFDQVADAMESRWATFASQFLTEAEQIAPAQSRLTAGLAALGLSMVDTRAAFTEALKAAPAGAPLQTSLLQLVDDADLVFDYFEKIAEESAKAAEAVADAADDAEQARRDAEAEARQARIDDAREAVSQAYDRTRDAAEGARDAMQGFADELKGLGKELDLGQAAGLSPEKQYKAAHDAFEDVERRIQAGDTEALDEVSDVIHGLTDASEGYFAHTQGFYEDLADAKALQAYALDLAQDQVTTADLQLDFLERSVGGILDLKDVVLTLPEAIARYNAELGGATSSDVARLAALAEANGVAIEDKLGELLLQARSGDATHAVLLTRVLDSIGDLIKAQETLARSIEDV